jgi:hypothetical protein
VLFSPRPFRYKKKLDPDGIAQFGLVAEEVEKVNPELVIRDEVRFETDIDPRQYSSSPVLRDRVCRTRRQRDVQQAHNTIVDKSLKLSPRDFAELAVVADIRQKPLQPDIESNAGNTGDRS